MRVLAGLALAAAAAAAIWFGSSHEVFDVACVEQRVAAAQRASQLYHYYVPPLTHECRHYERGLW